MKRTKSIKVVKKIAAKDRIKGPSATSWSAAAKWYDELLAEADTYQRAVVLPHLLRMMRVEKGERVVDVACGQGFFTRALAEAGATVVGADVSPELIELARKKNARIPYHVAPSHAMKVLGDASADKAALVLAIQNIEDVRGTFAECARILRSGGRLFVAMNHPAFRVPRRSDWGWDAGANVQFRRVDGYLTEAKIKIEMHPGKDPGSFTWSFHRPLQFYVKALARAGFTVVNLEEWTSHKKSDSGPRAEAENRARREIPLFLCLEAIKI